jgi:DNA polymerase-3 subunit gamma/tau
MFSLDSLHQVTQALSADDSRRMLDVVLELDRNGRNLQHFCRELARYFRNLLVAKISGANSRLIAASPAEQQRLVDIAAGFSEEDLTRYLQLTLDLFKDMQTSLQPRLHLEIGLLRLVQAGRLQPIEEALANLGGGGGNPSPPKPPQPKKTTPPPTPSAQTAPPPAATQAASVVATTQAASAVAAPQPDAPSDASWRERLHTALVELGMQFTADAIEHSSVAEAKGELHFTAPEEFRLAMNEKDILKAVQKIAGRPMRIKIAFGTPQPSQNVVSKPQADDVSERALAHPEVRRFQETFPDAQVRVVRNLKEST